MADRPRVGQRLDRAVDQGQQWAERGARELGGRLRARLRPDSGSGGGSAGGGGSSGGSGGGRPDAERAAAAAADPAAYFGREQLRAAEALGHANILVTGQTGVGKSTLINAIFGQRLAEESIGRPVTKHVQRHDAPGVPVTIYDTPGVELGDSQDEVIRELKKTIRASQKGGAGDLIHVLWYCIDAGQTRVQTYDTEIVRALAQDMPVILVFTQVIDDARANALERVVAEDALPIVDGRPVRTLALARTVGDATIEPRGLEELIRLTHRILPEAVRRAFTNAQGLVISLKVDDARLIVAGSTAVAAGIGAAPIPVPDAWLLLPVQLGMLAGITASFGIDMSTDSTTKLVRGLVGSGGISAVGRTMAGTLLKVVPGGGFITGGVAAGLTAALGEAHIQLCSELLRRQAAGQPMPDSEMLTFLLANYQRRFKRVAASRAR